MATWSDARIEDIVAGDELVVARPDRTDDPRAVVVVERTPSTVRGVVGWHVRVHDDPRPLYFPPGAPVRCRHRVN
jgi:hypothetical protein